MSRDLLQTDTMADGKRKGEGDEVEEKGKFVARNWNKVDERTLKKMAPQQKSRYLAYEEPSKRAADAAAATKKRIIEKRKKQRNQDLNPLLEDQEERGKHEKLIGQLKAAEARNRIRIMRMRYEANRGQEINHLIACQPSARKAVRLQALLPVKEEDRSHGDKLTKLARARVEVLLEDSQDLTISRT